MTILSLDEIFSKFDNIYEAVEVMALRARQITDEQKREIDMELSTQVDYDADIDEFGTFDIDRNALTKDYKIFPKSTVLAINEALNGELEYRYISSEKNVEKKKSKKEK